MSAPATTPASMGEPSAGGTDTSVFYEALCEVAHRRPEATAVRTTGGERLSYREFVALVDRFAGGLRAHGLRPAPPEPPTTPAEASPGPAGSTVAFDLRNSVGYLAALFAVARVGARYVPLLDNFDADDIATVVRRTGPTLLLTDGHRPAAPAVATLPRVSCEELAAADPLAPPDDSGPRHAGVFRMLWTSGSTEFPKLMAWRQDRLHRERLRWVADIGVEASDVFFCRHPLDVAHATDLHVYAALLSGAELLLADPDAPASELLWQLEHHGATVMSALPQHYADLVEAGAAALRSGSRPDLSRLRRPLCGGAYLEPEVIRRADETLGIRIRHIYGSTEFGLGLGNMDDLVQDRAGQRPVAGVGVRLEPFAGETDGDLGELVLISDCTSEGYLHHPEANARTFRDGEFWTGDLARRTEDDRYVILGRASEAMAGAQGPVVAPMLDEELHATDPIAQAVSLPVYPGEYDSRVYVTVLPARGCTREEAGRAVEEVLRRYGLKGETRFVEAIPRTPVGKVDKPRLRRAFATQES